MIALTQSQMGIYLECMDKKGELAYNLPYLYVFDKSLDGERFCKAVEAAIKAHPTLFTRLKLNGDEIPVMYIEEEPLSLKVEQTDGTDFKEYVKPFNLIGERLFHVNILEDGEHYYLLWDCHHIINDGTSMQTLLHDIETAYEGGSIEPEAMTLAEEAERERALRESDAREEGRKWYAENFDCEDLNTGLLPDQIPSCATTDFAERELQIDLQQVENFCKDNGIYKSTLFTTAYAFMLARYNNEQASLTRTVFNGRTDKRLGRTQGMFVKTLPVYCKFDDDTTVLDLLQRQQEQMAGCRKHEAYSYMDMMNDLHLESNNTFVWHGEMFADTLLMGSKMQTHLIGFDKEDDRIYMKAYICDGHIWLRAEFDGEYSKAFINTCIDSYEAVVRGMMSQQLLRDISLTGEPQWKKLDSFNDNDMPIDSTETVVGVFKELAKKQPDKTAVVFKDRRYTYREIDELSDRIAFYVQTKVEGQRSEPVVSILIPRCEWMAIASLGVLKAGCAYQPLDPTYPKERLNFMMQDAKVELVIAEEELKDLIDDYKGEVLFTKDIEKLPPAQYSAINSRPISPSDLFILLYTSGSTGTPKGVMLEHRNVMAFCRMHQKVYRLHEDSRVGAYASFGFDASLQELWAPLTIGATIYIIPEEMRLDLISLNEYFEKNGITHGFMTTQVARQFVNDIENHSLQVFITGGEKLADVTPPPYLLLNGYGPTESICYVTAYEVREKQQNIPIGKAVPNMHLYIIDRYGHRQPIGAAGELWVSGLQVARGYLNLPEKTAEAFVEDDNGKRYYKTGDIVRYLTDGNIEYVGRRDGQVKIRGFRIELKEVEAIIREYPGIKDVTVQAFDQEGGGKYIAAYIVSDETINIKALNKFIMEEKPPYMVPAATMQIERIPLNQNQKVDKRALPKPEISATEQEGMQAPLNILEQELHDMIAKIIHTENFGVTTVLGYVGLTSIMAIQLAVAVNKRFGVALNSKTLVKTGTLQSIENEVLRSMMYESHGNEKSGERSEEQNTNSKPLPLSYAQTGVYVECVKQPLSTVYNIPMKIAFPPSVKSKQLAEAVKMVIAAHPQLTVCFDIIDGNIMQIVRPELPIELAETKMTEAELENYKQEFVRPFNLKSGLLYHAEIVETEKRTYLLMDIHHLVSDGASTDVILQQICSALEGNTIEKEQYTYTQFVIDQQEAENGPQYAAAEAFFKEQLSECEEVTEVPADLPNPISQGETESVSCPFDIESVEHFCREHQLTLAHLTLAAVFYTLARFSNNERVTLTTISNGRADVRTAETVGMFVNTLVMSTKVGDQRVLDFLGTVSKLFDKTLEHENYPFAQLAANYNLSAEIMFAYQIGVLNQYMVGGQTLELENMELPIPKFRIAFYILEEEGVPSVRIEYDNGHYSEGLMKSLAQSVVTALTTFVQKPDENLLHISLLNDVQENILDSFNDTDVPYDNTQTIVSLFKKQVVAHPDNVAVVYHENSYTYHEVDDLSDRIAEYVRSKVKGHEPVVSIIIPRCEWMVIASLGVLKAGCAYQPLDPSYPKERLNFMMQDADAQLLIADETMRDIVDEYKGEVLLTKNIKNLPTPQPSTINAQPISPSDLFILLYTSGSTGTPKGVMLEHGNLVAFCHWYHRYYELTDACRVAAYASYGFDACMMDIYPAITCGAAVYIIGDDIRLNLPDLNDYFNAHGITHSFITTQVGYQFATNVENHSLRHFSVGGEKLSALQPPTNYVMHNGYGPTECTIFTTIYPLEKYELDIPIGKPLDNLKLYIVDKDLNRLPQGAMGELWISGPQVGRGYLNLPEKTAETFIDAQWPKVESQRCYRTGDIVRYLPDGNIQFVGRRDGQVKIRGFRIELKEVEAVIREYPGIKDATVQAFDYDNGGKYIAAYIVSDEQVDIAALNKFIGQTKPPYMVPAATMQIDCIPLNQNQKVNRKALPKPVIQINTSEYVEPANETERLLCSIFGDILGMERYSSNADFFELGGTSLMVTRVIIEADKLGRHIAYGDVFSHPTPQQLAAYLTGNGNDSGNKKGETGGKDTADSEFDYSPINTLLMRNTLDAFRHGQRQTIGNVLLTGSTGYLGIHVLKELIDREDVPEIYCLVRAEDLDKGERRLKNLLFYYYKKNYKELFGSRLHVVLGDVTKKISVDAHIDTVYNCAAIVKHYSSGTEIENVNIGGAVNCMLFCIETGARLIHISTYSTAGLSVNGQPASDIVQTEQKLYYGQYMDNRYVHSKFVAERTILEAIALHGLNAKVMRVGNLAPRSTDGEFQINAQTNSSMGRVKVFRTLGCYPYEMTDQPLEFSPINEVAHAIVLLSETSRECCLFHPFNNHYVHFGDVLQELRIIGDAPRQVEKAEYEETLNKAKNDPVKAQQLQSLLAYQDLAHGQQAVAIHTTNDFTTQVLYRMGFRWSATSWDYVDRFVTAIDELGFFEY